MNALEVGGTEIVATELAFGQHFVPKIVRS